MSSDLQTNVSPNYLEQFHKKIEEFIAETSPHVCILTPCYGSQCFVNYTTSLLETIHSFEKLGIRISVEFCKNDSLVCRARNNLIAKAMSDPSITHFMFIDNDITWQSVDILKLLISKKSVVGGVYPIKKYNWDKLVEPNAVENWINKKNKSEVGSFIDTEAMVQHNLLKYNVNFLDKVISIENNLTKVKHLATGFMLISRGTIEKMAKAFPSTKYVDDVGFLKDKENDFAYALFDCGVEEGRYFSEDWLFCHRWRKMGGNIYMDVTINLSHMGMEEFKGSYLSSIL